MGYFDRALFTFLKELKENNDREWFKANKERYEADVKEPLLDFIADADGPLSKVSKHLVADPRPVGGSMFRIYRDTRFSKDKTPYKTAASAQFKLGQKDVHGPGLYLHLEPGECFVGGGMWMPHTQQLNQIRERIVDKPAEWKKVAHLVNDGYPRLKRPPRGFDPDHPFIEDLKRKSFTSGEKVTQKEVLSEDFMSIFIERAQHIAPLLRFLAKSVGVSW